MEGLLLTGPTTPSFKRLNKLFCFQKQILCFCVLSGQTNLLCKVGELAVWGKTDSENVK